MKVETN